MRKRIVFIAIVVFLAMTACAPTGVFHTVKPGQTLYRIAVTYGVDEDELAHMNGISDPTQLKVEQRLYIPGATQLRHVPSTAKTNTSSSYKPVKSKSQATKPTKSDIKKNASTKKTSSLKAKATNTRTGKSVAAKPAKGSFVWPVKGKVLNRFGKHGEKVYKGIEVSSPNKSSVVAAASGKVIYSGNGIPGYGNLIIIEHSDSFFSVYGFNHKNLVEMDDYVGQGDKIALSGIPPNGQSARLHFEIRKGKSAVNPILYLP